MRVNVVGVNEVRYGRIAAGLKVVSTGPGIPYRTGHVLPAHWLTSVS